jgi:hypothetical protein
MEVMLWNLLPLLANSRLPSSSITGILCFIILILIDLQGILEKMNYLAAELTRYQAKKSF